MLLEPFLYTRLNHDFVEILHNLRSTSSCTRRLSVFSFFLFPLFLNLESVGGGKWSSRKQIPRWRKTWGFLFSVLGFLVCSWAMSAFCLNIQFFALVSSVKNLDYLLYELLIVDIQSRKSFPESSAFRG